MAGRNDMDYRYQMNGSAAYEAERGTRPGAVPAGRELPQDRPVERVQTRHKLSVSPEAILGVLTVACMMLLVLFAFERLYETTNQISRMESELSELQAEQVALRSQYEGMIDFQTIESSATRLGMSKPSVSQTVYVNLAGEDRAEVVAGSLSPLKALARLTESAFANLSAYLSQPAA